MDKGQTLLATIISPFSSLIIAMGLFAEEAVRNPSGMISGGIIIVLLFSVGFVATSAAFVVLIGLPLHFLYSRKSLKNVLLYCLSGIFVALAYQYFTNMVPPSLQAVGYWVYAASGLIVSLTFWWLAVKNART